MSALAWTNSALARGADAVAAPLRGWPPLAGLLLLSAATAAAMLLVIARTADQTRTSAVKRHIQAALLEIRLFNDDPSAVLRSMRDLLRLNLRYLRLSIVPLLWMALPLALVVSHLDPFFGYDGLMPGVPALVKVEHPAGSEFSSAELVAPAAIRVEISAADFSATHETLWRIVPVAQGDYQLTIRVAGNTVEKSVHVGSGLTRRSLKRVAPGIVDQLRYPSEPPLADWTISAIGVSYPDSTIDVFGWHVHWLIVYIVVSALFARALAWPFGVTL